MKITKKCPNCFQQIPAEDRFCTFCGYDLYGAKASGEGMPDVAETVDSAPDILTESAASIPFDGPRFCPKGHDVTDPSLGFCSVCGMPLVSEPPLPEETEDRPIPEPVPEPEPVSAPVVSKAAPRRIRRCANCGYECDDPEIKFCLSCGVPLDEPKETGWVCSCGAYNDEDMHFCTACGQPREKRREPEPRPAEPPKTAEKDYIPGGMAAPTDRDLEIK